MRLVVLDGYPVELLGDGSLRFGTSFSLVYEELSRHFAEVRVVVPHVDRRAGRKLNRAAGRAEGLSFHLLPFFADPADFFRRAPRDLASTVRGLLAATRGADALLLRYPSPVAPLALLAARFHRLRVVPFAMGSWLETVRSLPPGPRALAQQLVVGAFELFHRRLVARRPSISTAPYLDEFPAVRFGFVTALRGEEIPPPAPRPPRTGRPARLLFVGRLTDAKGLPVLLEAFERLLAAGTDARLEIAGDGYLADELARRVTRPPLAGRVVLAGELDWPALDRRYREADLFVLPSLTEGVPKVLLEAMTRGCPSVSTRVGSVPRLFRDGEHLRLVAPGDAAGLAAAMGELLADPDAAAAMATRAHAVAARCDLATTVARLAELVDECAREAR